MMVKIEVYLLTFDPFKKYKAMQLPGSVIFLQN